MKFHLKIKYFHSRKCVWTCRLRNGGHFVQGEMSSLHPQMISNGCWWVGLGPLRANYFNRGRIVCRYDNMGGIMYKFYYKDGDTCKYYKRVGITLLNPGNFTHSSKKNTIHILQDFEPVNDITSSTVRQNKLVNSSRPRDTYAPVN